MTKEIAFATRAIRSGHQRTAEDEHSEAIFLTSSFAFPSAADAAARFSGEQAGNIYSRFTNPSVRLFNDRLAALEGGDACVATASGMAAILSVTMALLKQGDELVAAHGLFGTTSILLEKYLTRFGIGVRFVAPAALDEWAQAITARTRMLLLETPTNPLLEIVDLAALAELAQKRGCLLVVDNCLCTPVLQRPLALGADLIVHSATKYIDGQGRCLGGAVVGNANLVGEEVFAFLRSAGPSLSPFNAWVLGKGLETLALRMAAHSKSALQIAHWLCRQPAVEKVYYPGLTKHPGHALAARQQGDFGGIVSFVIKGGRAAAWRFIDRCRFFSITANLGDAKSTITHPASTTHSRLRDAQKAQAGIVEGLIRLSVGLEAVADLQQDLSDAFNGKDD